MGRLRCLRKQKDYSNRALALPEQRGRWPEHGSADLLLRRKGVKRDGNVSLGFSTDWQARIPTTHLMTVLCM